MTIVGEPHVRYNTFPSCHEMGHLVHLGGLGVDDEQVAGCEQCRLAVRKAATVRCPGRACLIPYRFHQRPRAASIDFAEHEFTI